MSSGRRRTTDRHYSAEEQALDQISKEAEERIQARRQARAEAREIRLREIERQQKEEEDRQKAQQQGSDSKVHYYKSVSSFSGSRRGSNDSTESDVSSKDSKDPKDHVRQIKTQLRELEDKYKAAMVTNAQLDNTKTSQVFQLELLKEQLEEQEEGMIEVQREYKDKCREYDLLKRDFENLKLECDGIKQQIELKDKLLKESGLVIVTTDEGEFSLTKCSNLSDVPTPELGTSIISEEAADMLKKAGEGTLGKSKEEVNSLDLQKEVCNSGVDNEVKAGNNSELAENENVVEIKSRNEEIPAVDNNITEKQDTNTVELDEENNNDAHSKSEMVIGAEERQGEEERSGSMSDENEVFYESKSEISPLKILNEKGERNDIADIEKQKDDERVENKVESNEKVEELNVYEKERGSENEVIVLVSEQVDDIADTSTENIERVTETQYRYLETESSEMKRKSGSLSGVRKILYSESVISLESDVTYHSESEDNDFFLEAEKENVGSSSSDVNLNENVEDEKVLMTDDKTASDSKLADEVFDEGLGEDSLKVVDSNLECRVETEEVCSTGANVEIVGDSDVTVVDNAVAENLEDLKSPDKENLVLKVDVGSSVTGEEVCTSTTQSDEVFMSLPLDKMGYDQNMVEFAKNYVTDVVLKSVDMYNKQLKDEKITVRKQSYTSENIDISIPKKHYSEELVDTVSAVIPRKLSSGSVEILSPVVHIPSENKGDLKFFTYKVDADADVVLTNIEEEKNPLEGMVTVDSLQSPISGFGICFSGVEGHSDVDSKADSSTEDAEEIKSETGTSGHVDFISMPVAVNDKVNEEHKDSEISEFGGKEVETSSSVDSDGVKQEADSKTEVVSEEKSGNIVDSSLVSPDINEKESERDSIIDKDKNEVNEELVEKSGSDDEREKGEFEGDGKKSGMNNGQLESDENNVEKKGELGSGREPNSDKEIQEKIEEEKDDKDAEGATGVDSDKSETSPVNENDSAKAESTENVTEPGSRLSGEISPNEESGQSIDSGSMNRKKSKKKGAKKNSKEECLIS